MAALLVGCGLRNPPELRARGLQPSVSTAEALNAALSPRRVALVIGVDPYDDPAFPTLQHAGHDADLMAGILEDASGGGFDEVRRLVGGPDRQRIVGALRDLRRELRREDVLVVYFSGHGTRVSDPEQGPRRFLLARDSRASDLENSAVDLSVLQGWFTDLPPARKVLIVDACFNGDGKSVLRPTTRNAPAGPQVPVSTALGAGEAHLFATSPGRPALEDDRLGHGVYTYYLLEAMSWDRSGADLDADGAVTAWEAHDHARSRTLAHTDGVQVPEAALRMVGMADVVLAGSREGRPEQDKALVYLYPSSGHPLDGAQITIDGRTRGALPGTIPVAAGRHHLRIEAPDGRVLAQGHLTLAAGRSVHADTLPRLLAGPSRGVALRPMWLTSPGFAQAVAGPAPGVELSTYRRDDDAPGRGLITEARLGLAWPTARRHPVDGTVVRDARTVVQLGVEIGVQHDWRRMRARGTWSLGGVWIPPDHRGQRPEGFVDPFTVPAAAGWIFGTTGPSLTVAWVGAESWSVGLTARPHVTGLDLDGDGRSSVLLWATASLGPEWIF